MAISYAVENEETEAYDYVTEINGTSLTYSSVYNETTEISKYVITDVAEITSDTDDFGRTEKVYLKDSSGEELLTCTYGYVEKTVSGELRTSEYISSMTYSGLNSNSYTYTYDENGNIISVSDGILTTSYVYDNLNQLVRENNQQFNRTTTYTYDKSGNILSKSQYSYTTGTLGTATDTVNYVYGNTNWGDQLTSYDGTTISYDAQGNPLNWGINTLNWSGRTLLKYGVYEFIYDSNGLRTQKSMPVGGNNSYETNYIYDDDNRLIAETFLRGDGYETETYYYYGENGNPVAWRYNDTLYYYILNQQGDIMGFTDEDGEEEVSYYYDAWGDILDYGGDSEIAEANSLLYRGYVYDWETELYYLQSRYYDPVVGRFLNADDTDYLGASGTTLGYNLYAYCENSIICYCDHTGNLLEASHTSILSAVKAFAEVYNELSIKNMYEYATFIFRVYYFVVYGFFKIKRIARYGYYTPWTDKSDRSVDISRIKKLKRKYDVVALVHTHGGTIVPNMEYEFFSVWDRDAARELKKNFYLITPAGRIKVFYYKTGREREFGTITTHGFNAIQVYGWHPRCSKCVII